MIEKAKEFLNDWISEFIKNKNIMLRSVESIEKNKFDFDVYVKHNDKEQFIITIPIIDNLNVALDQFKDKEKHYSIVTFNNKKNLNQLLNNWATLADYKHLSIFFVNPFSQLDKRWIIHPHTHNKICEKSSLSRGIKTMFEMVDPISEEEIKSKF